MLIQKKLEVSQDGTTLTFEAGENNCGLILTIKGIGAAPTKLGFTTPEAQTLSDNLSEFAESLSFEKVKREGKKRND